MSKQRVLRAVPIAAVAMAGVLLGHWLAYVAAVPRGILRAETLAATGHGYWTEAVRVAAALGVSGVAALVLAHFRSDACEGSHPERFSSLILRLGPIQGAAFLAIESA